MNRDPDTIVGRVRRALAVLGDIDKDLDVAALSPEDLLQVGQRIWWINKRLNKAFEPVKARLREIALAADPTPGNHRFEAPDGSHAIVTIQNVTPTLRKDADMDRVRAVLGPKFDEVFDLTVSYRLRMDVDVLALGPAERTAVMQVLDFVDVPPNVAFKD